jgi:hypothetical protein
LGERHREFDEIVAHARALQKGSEDDKQDDERGGRAKRNAEDTLCGGVERVDKLNSCEAAVAEAARQLFSDQHICNRNGGDDWHAKPILSLVPSRMEITSMAANRYSYHVKG